MVIKSGAIVKKASDKIVRTLKNYWTRFVQISPVTKIASRLAIVTED